MSACPVWAIAHEFVTTETAVEGSTAAVTLDMKWILMDTHA